MVSIFRLKGRALQIDNTAVMTLTFMTGLAVMVTAGLLPVTFDRLVLSFVASYGEKAYLWARFSAALLFIVISFGVYSALRLGAKRYLFKKAVRKKPVTRDIFFYFGPKHFFSALLYSFRLLLVKLSVMSFCLLPSGVCLGVVDSLSRQGVSALVCLSMGVTAALLFINGMLFYSLFCSSFFLCDYYFIDGKYLSFRHLISSSQKNMQGKNALLARLRLSFSGWLLLCIPIFPVPYVWGYYNQSLAVAAAEFME